MCPWLSQVQAPGRNTASLSPGHFLGLLPRGRHLDHVPQEGHPAFFDQQRAVLVRCGGGGEGRQHVIRVGLLSACGPETLPCSEDGPPRTGDEDVGLSEGVAAGAMLARPRGQVPEATCRKRGVNPLGKALPFASWWHLPPNVTHSGPFYSLRSVCKNKDFLSTAPRGVLIQQIQEHVFICTFNKISPGDSGTHREETTRPAHCWASWFTPTKNILGLGIQGCIDTPERTWAFQWSSSSCTV